jgi:hypothetical protein
MPRYRLVEDIDWPALDGAKVVVGVSRSNLVLELKDGSLLKFAVALRERPSRNGTMLGEEPAAVSDTLQAEEP